MAGDKKLVVEMSWWGMNHLEGTAGHADTAEAKCRLIAENGFDGINAFLPAPEEAAEWKRLMSDYGLSFSVNAYSKTLEEMAEFMEKALAYGDGLSYVNAQVLTPFLIDEPAVRLLEGIDRLSREAGLPVYIETHRGTITQDLIRTAAYIRELPSLRLTIDYSHYVVAGELHTISPEAEHYLQSLLPAAHSIHTRISNGEQVQVDPGEDGNHPMLPHFARWWETAMKHFLARPGREAASFPVAVELGPPSYAITADEAGARSIELGDRWRQSLYLQRLVRELWTKAQASAERAAL